MKIKGLTKTTLVDYPSHVATTIFTQGCNMRCPYCHNKDLVVPDINSSYIRESEFFQFLEKRRGKLEGICITGGEPTLQEDLLEFMASVKSYGYKVKLDTNGLNPSVVEQALSKKSVDYIAMDIKNSPKKYSITSGIADERLNYIQDTINLLLNSTIDYEFRTTIVKDFHEKKDFIEIGLWIQGAKNYYLQQYKESPHQLSNQTFKKYKKDELLAIKKDLLKYVENVEIRGI